MRLRHIRGKTTGLAPISLNSNKSPPFLCCSIHGLLGVLLPLRQPTVGVGRSRCGGHDVAETADEHVVVEIASHEQALNPEQGLKPTIGSKADRDRRCRRSFRARLPDRRGPRSNDGLWGGRLSASNAMDAHPPRARTGLPAVPTKS
jgi:hypothetical protein